MQVLLRISHIIDAMITAVGRLIGLIVVLLVLLGVYNVVTRYVGPLIGTNLYSQGMAEAQYYVFSLIFFLGFAYILRRNENVRVDFWYGAWSDRRKALVNLLGNVFFLIPFCLLGLYVAYPSVMRSWQQREMSGNAGGLAIYPLKTMILFAFVLLLLQAISEVIKHLAVLTGHTSSVIHAAEAYQPEPVE